MDSTWIEGLLGPARCEGCGARRGALCPSCAARVERAAPPPRLEGLDAVVAPWSYQGAARDLVLSLKLRGNRAAAAPLAAAVTAAVHAHGLVADTIVWVPGRRGDRRRRGFDHAEVLARSVARRLGLPSAPILVRRRNPPDQSTLSGAERRRNLAGAFAARPCAGGVAIVDDLVTTGATGIACARALREAGAARVELLAPCRAQIGVPVGRYNS